MRQWPEGVEGGNTCRRRIARGEADDNYGPLPIWGSSGDGGGGDGGSEKETTNRPVNGERPKRWIDTHEPRG